ncbi:DUF4241 domain-containing protein [Bacillus cereus group sp. BfR-BA-01331]|uniref:DUF4241 domain-containing protein n=1 Tax=Bacillus cereus group sp. BfR-BA-01331 TaxID=2920307 RepID=UPI001F589E4E|nr:DUF4241 domain-containing protein [Bacillus cereus group sp. BfR-BA-01331]
MEEERQKENSDYYIYLEFEDEFDKTYKDTCSWLVTKIKEKASSSMFSICWGDGSYLSFWGLDENGDVVF